MTTSALLGSTCTSQGLPAVHLSYLEAIVIPWDPRTSCKRLDDTEVRLRWLSRPAVDRQYVLRTRGERDYEVHLRPQRHVRARLRHRLLPRKDALGGPRDRKITRLNSSHANISYAVFCLKKKSATL